MVGLTSGTSDFGASFKILLCLHDSGVVQCHTNCLWAKLTLVKGCRWLKKVITRSLVCTVVMTTSLKLMFGRNCYFEFFVVRCQKP